MMRKVVFESSIMCFCQIGAHMYFCVKFLHTTINVDHDRWEKCVCSMGRSSLSYNILTYHELLLKIASSICTFQENCKFLGF